VTVLILTAVLFCETSGNKVLVTVMLLSIPVYQS